MRAFLAAALLVGCNPALWPDPEPVRHPEGACASAEYHLRDLGCSSSAGFAGLCERSAGRGVDLHPQCVAKITTCAQFNDASRGCP